ncbi:MAG: peptide ABC transporter substrate-binding protein [Thermaerobacter sp.]|nr:peptide ABC transporter substrate-binding protein [Thermaerobacter sp.]
MRRSIKILSVAAALGAAGLAGCGTSQPASVPVAPTSATIALLPQVSPNWWFPVLSSSAYSDTNLQMNALMYVPLIHISRTDGINFSRSLAQSISVNSTGTVYTIHLNRKFKWSNGTPVTSADVVFTYNILKATSTGASNLPWGYGGAGTGGLPARWQSVVAQGPDTVVVTLNTPSNPVWFEHNGLGQIEPVPAAVWNKYPNNMIEELKFIQSVANNPSASVYQVVDGPYHFSKMAPNQYWMFSANNQYDGHKSTLQKIVFQYETSSSAEFAGLKTGTIQLGFLPASLWKSRAQLTSDVFFPAYLFGFNYLQPNLNPKAPNGLGPVFDQPYVRAALEMGIPQQAIISTFYHGYGVTENNPIPSQPKTIFYDAALAKPLYPFNPAAGKALLVKNGWTDVNGVMTKNGVQLKFTLLYVSGSNTDTAIAQLIKQDWAQEGVQVSLESQPFDTVLSTAQQADPSKWNMAWWGGGWTYEPDYYPTGGAFYATGAGANQGGYTNPTMDTLIKNSYNPGTSVETLNALFAYQQFAAQQTPVIWLPWTAGFNEHASNLHGTVKTFNSITALIYPNWWTTTAK